MLFETRISPIVATSNGGSSNVPSVGCLSSLPQLQTFFLSEAHPITSYGIYLQKFLKEAWHRETIPYHEGSLPQIGLEYYIRSPI